MDLTSLQTQARALDAADALSPLRELFDLPPDVVYLDGNSLGPLPRSARRAVTHALEQEWGQGLIRSWGRAGWLQRAAEVGDRLAPLLGVGPGEVMVADSTSLNLYKVLAVAMELADLEGVAVERMATERMAFGQPSDPPGGASEERAGVRPRRVLLTEADNFPTDRYLAQRLCAERGWELRICAPQADGRFDASQLAAPEVAVLMLTQVHYRTGALHDMQAINRQASAHGVLTVWDLAHSAGALPVALRHPGAECDFAVGCGYKYLNGGPGAPAFVWVHPRHVERAEQPLRGWLGHARPFDFAADYAPAPGIARYVCGTPPILSLTALQAGVETLRAADALGGMSALRAKSLSLTDFFRRACAVLVPPGSLECITPLDAAHRGSQLSFAVRPPRSAARIMATLIERGVIGDHRPGDASVPDILRFGFAPLYNTHADALRAAECLGAVLRTG